MKSGKAVGISVLCVLNTLVFTTMAATHFVDPASPGPNPPYASWATAATNIQDAVDAAASGETVLVTNGLYLLSSEILVANNITIQSVNGPASTIVDGQGNVRCFNLANPSCVISGLTISNGGNSGLEGGGVNCTNSNPVITNCVIVGNTGFNGGGIRYGTAYNCTIIGNHAANGAGIYGGDAYNCTIAGNVATNYGGGMVLGTADNCIIISNSVAFGPGGGLYQTVADDCLIMGNSASSGGGGMAQGTANNCILSGNSAVSGSFGGGTYQTTANSCLIYSNTAARGGGTYSGNANNCTIVKNSAGRGGGIYAGTANNSIIWDNSGTLGPNLNGATATYSCSPEVTHGVSGNITNAPVFIDEVNDNYRLQSGSPCINAGTNGAVVSTMDLDGNPRIGDGVVDMGAYEYGSSSSASCQITNLLASSSQVIIEWTSTTSLNAEVRWTDNLTNGFIPIATNLYPLNSYTDTVHTIDDQGFYQIKLY